MCNAPNALDWDGLFGSHKINRSLESNALQVIAQEIDLIHMDFHTSQQRQTKTACFLLKLNQLNKQVQILKQSYVLASKISIDNAENKDLNLAINSKFYLKYSRFTFKALNKMVFQKFLADMLKNESIPQKSIDSISIEVLPALRKNGLTIAGKCNIINGKIRIYPKPLKFCDAFRKEYGQCLLVEYAANRARAALIHELLHLKYGNDEVGVRRLTKEYYSQLIKNEHANSPKSLHICKLIFAR